MIALSFALLAHGFRVVGAAKPHEEPVGEEFAAFGAEQDVRAGEIQDIEVFEGEGSLIAVVVLLAVNLNEPQQRPDVVLLGAGNFFF